MNLGIIIQARMGSKRLPGKVLKEFKKISPLKLLVDKINFIGLKSSTIIATTNKKSDLKIINFCKMNNIKYFIGSNDNVLRRYYECSKKFKIKNIIRLTADCPFLDISLLKRMISIYKKNKYDYLSNAYPLPCTFPDGSDIEIFSFNTLEESHLNARLPSEKEHVTNYIYGKEHNNIKRIDLKNDLSKYRYTIDNINDFKVFEEILKVFKYDEVIKLKYYQIANFLKKNKKLILYQKKLQRNYGWKSSIEKDIKYLRTNS
jgi:spore coat polysaccharide biosynthesis protein SpsF